jgi:hypothetical protein
MNEPFGDGPVPAVYYPPSSAMVRRERVLTLARELLLNDNVYRTLDQYIIRAEEWIRAEDAYVLPEDMQ